MKLLKIVVLVVLMLMPVSVLACTGIGTKATDKQVPIAYQKLVPYKIILPTDLPENLRSATPIFEGPYRGLTSPEYPNSVQTHISYPNANGDVNIYEEDIRSEPVIDNTTTILDIAGVKVYEDDVGQTPLLGNLSQSSTVYIQQFSYFWTKNNVSYNVLIGSYEKDECRKIVQSMIKQ